MHHQIIPGWRKLFLCLTLLLAVLSSAIAFQGTKTLKLSQVYKEIISSNEKKLTYDHVKIIDDITEYANDPEATDFIASLEAILDMDIATDTMGIISKVREISINDLQSEQIAIQFLNLSKLTIVQGSFDYLTLNAVRIDTALIQLVKVKGTFLIKNSHFGEYRELQNDHTRSEIYETEFNGHYRLFDVGISSTFWIYDSKFGEGANFEVHFKGTYNDFYMEGNTFEPIDSAIPVSMEGFSPNPAIFRTQARFNFFGNLHQFYLIENKFHADAKEQFIFVEGEFEYMAIDQNLIESQFYPEVTVSRQLMFLDNEITGNIIFTELILQGKNNNMHWRDLGGFKLASASVLATMLTSPLDGHEIPEEQIAPLLNQTSDVAFTTYQGLTDEDFEDEDMFQGFISSYYRLYKVFKDNGQIRDANQTYVEMKDVQLRQLRYKYKTHGGLENWIQWRLNGLLRFYTDYGTNPSRAIRISIFVVLVFSIFYFFFPSEWDTKSKKQLINDYRTFVEKNKHGYIKPFFKLSFGFFKSLLNAMTLSLNAFVTLGFGTIPTSGLARYICIIQGFIGWFLLSIFTASLINQVLF
ncbi:MAG: two pore domain potassium channel family protein [Roseivirga sp.]|nr:two pore domain potassium channel family protein [Roseivirga sp.]